MNNDHTRTAKAARPLPDGGPKCYQNFCRVMSGKDNDIYGVELVAAINTGFTEIVDLGNCINDPSYNDDWLLFVQDDSGEIKWETIYSTAHYSTDFVRKVVAFAKTGSRQFCREPYITPADIVSTKIKPMLEVRVSKD